MARPRLFSFRRGALFGFARASLTILLVCLWSLVEVYIIRSRLQEPPPLITDEFRPTRTFIVSLHWNNERILRSHWNQAVADLVVALGPANVFVSILESGSWDGTKQALQELDSKLDDLGVRRHIELLSTTHRDEIQTTPPLNATGWVFTPRGRRELRRIPFLSRLRNASLEPLRNLSSQGVSFDKVLFLNDVVFTTEDALRLLSTNNGAYSAACALDFARPPALYDTFALRDADGHEAATSTWPYFRSRASYRALKLGRPAPVRSCWNGMVAMPAALFVGPNLLSFRGVPDSLAATHIEGSECCLVHADAESSDSDQGVYVNPHVRVGYSGGAYAAVHRGSGSGGAWLSARDIWVGLWRNRISRWVTTPAVKEWRIRELVRAWNSGGDAGPCDEKGVFCLVNEMQVLVENGWAHV